MGFHEIQFPPDVSYGAAGGPGYSTTVVATLSGREYRNSNWASARGRWNVAHGLRNREQVAALIAFFRARKGRAHGFRFKDWTDYQATGQVVGTGDGQGVAYQLVKTYSSGAETESRIIAKPVAGSLRITLDGIESDGWSLDATTGLVTFSTPPAGGVIIAADFDFDVPARFDTDHMDLAVETWQLGTWGSIPIVEIRP